MSKDRHYWSMPGLHISKQACQMAVPDLNWLKQFGRSCNTITREIEMHGKVIGRAHQYPGGTIINLRAGEPRNLNM